MLSKNMHWDFLYNEKPSVDSSVKRWMFALGRVNSMFYEAEVVSLVWNIRHQWTRCRRGGLFRVAASCVLLRARGQLFSVSGLPDSVLSKPEDSCIRFSFGGFSCVTCLAQFRTLTVTAPKVFTLTSQLQ